MGGRKVLSLDEYASHFKNIDPVSQYKMWRTKQTSDCSSQHKESVPRYDVYSDRVSAAFVVSDPVDWGRDIQVLHFAAYNAVLRNHCALGSQIIASFGIAVSFPT